METQSTALHTAAAPGFRAMVERLYAEPPALQGYQGTLESAIRVQFALMGQTEWKRDAFRTLLLHLYGKKCYAVLRNPGFIEIVANIAAFGNKIVRPIEEWKKDSLTAEGQMASMLRHCFAKYDVPEFMEYAFAGNNRIHMYCYIKLGRGDRVQSLGILPAGFTAKMAHEFRNTPKHFTIVQAIRRAQALGCGATPARAEAIAWAHELEHYQNPVFALAAIAFAAKAQARIAFNELQSVLRYLNAAYVADNAYNFKGRTWASVTIRAALYHAELAKRHAAEQFSDWELCNVKDYEVEKESGIFRIIQLGTSQELYDEGAEQSHCVADYAYDCTIGSCAIFSLRKYVPGEEGHDILATIEVAVETREIVQAKAKFNGELSDEAFNIMSEWARAENLADGICYDEYVAPEQQYEGPQDYGRPHGENAGTNPEMIKWIIVAIIKLIILIAKMR
ncbi:PcfJ domain-containing protein [uncultured Flavobacterium sp.]|uniref:PcfJ domain-containing protein n=1 Tax=uncultured Flavobacterium sp. TaxID=165435 RepID=UPI0025E756CD|nr:PcfJ domain-containing protein [uncultured Flavobacterium sp.]